MDPKKALFLQALMNAGGKLPEKGKKPSKGKKPAPGNKQAPKGKK